MFAGGSLSGSLIGGTPIATSTFKLTVDGLSQAADVVSDSLMATTTPIVQAAQTGASI